MLLVASVTFAVAVHSVDAGDSEKTGESEHAGESVFTAEQLEFFESKVRPVLVAHCYNCHSTDAREVKAGLYVDRREGLIQGGESGPAIVVGQPDESLLIAAVRYETNEMPPDRKLSDQDVEALAQWVTMGAPWPQVTSSPGIPVAGGQPIDWREARASHWAWQSVSLPVVPAVNSGNGPSTVEIMNPIDCFVTARRQRAGLEANDPAPPEVLIRRFYVDLIGVVPPPQEIEEFVRAAQKNRQLAVGQWVDKLLQSPRYGQRWARHWLDVARYSDGSGGFLDNRSLNQAWRYRDWVIDAMNRDQPIDEFFKLQIAGDLMGGPDDAIATGFFALGPTYSSDGGDPDSVAQATGETLDDRVDTLTRGLLGITGSCARCHDHKFDPIPTQDYYSLAGVFKNCEVHDLPLEAQEKSDLANRPVTDRNDSQQKPGPDTATAHVLRDTGAEDMHVAIRGNLRKTGALAPRRFLRILVGDDPPRFAVGSGRRELADAIVCPSNPLTARVFVNRIWMHHFGNGLVRTPSNFGTLGELPTHPQLLDWLAADFVHHGWSLKRLHRQIMTSATYQLSSGFCAESFRTDGDDRLLWRMSPRRMDVEAWRDSLLSVCGELDDSLSGPPVAEITGSRRRTIYAKVSRNGDVFESDLFLRRFDFPLMRATVAKRNSSIVPQQFLFLLNSRFIIDRAKAFAARLERESTTDEGRITHAYQLLYGRRPEATEQRVAREFLASKRGDEGELTAWVQYAQALLSSNEFMYVR